MYVGEEYNNQKLGQTLKCSDGTSTSTVFLCETHGIKTHHLMHAVSIGTDSSESRQGKVCETLLRYKYCILCHANHFRELKENYVGGIIRPQRVLRYEI